MSRFMLLLHESEAGREEWARMSPEEMQKGVEQYVAWTRKPFVVGSERLGEDVGRVLLHATGNGRARVADGPYSETKEVLGGFYMIEARDYDEAVERTMDHPHLQHGDIEIRQIYGS